MDSDSNKEHLHEILQALRLQRQALDDLTGSIARLVKALEQEDYLRERAERAEDREQDERHERVIEAIDDVRDRLEGVGAAHRDLPDALLRTVEKKIYELRTARWEALQAGVSDEPAPLMPAPSRREPTGSQRLLLPATAASAPEDERRERSLHEAIGHGAVWFAKKSWRWLLATGMGGAIAEALHKAGLI